MNDANGTFQNNPRDYALELVEEQYTSYRALAMMCLSYMSHAEVRDMLSANELAPKNLEY